MKNCIKAAVFAATVAAAASTSAGTTYKFTVLCQHRQSVVQWNTGAIDPGKEYLRVATGTNNPGCTVTDFEPSRDGRLPVDTYSGAGGVVQGIPFVGEVLGRVFGF